MASIRYDQYHTTKSFDEIPNIPNHGPLPTIAGAMLAMRSLALRAVRLCQLHNSAQLPSGMAGWQVLYPTSVGIGHGGKEMTMVSMVSDGITRVCKC